MYVFLAIMEKSKKRHARRKLQRETERLFREFSSSGSDSNDEPMPAVETSQIAIRSDKSDLGSADCSFVSDLESAESSSSSSLLSMDDVDVIGEDVEQQCELQFDLATWAVSYNCSRECINELLCLLRNSGLSELPKDSRTLLRTPRTVQTTTKCGGTFWYVGIENGINKAFSFLSLDTDAIKLVVNIDGLPLSKSSSSQLWPILGSINNSNHVFPIAIFHAYAKPNSLADYLSEFIVEAKTLLQDGVRIENKLYQFNLQAIICDAPARSFLKCIIGHTGYHSCERCKIKGQYLQNRIVFNDFGADERRTDQEFRSLSYQHSHQKNEISPLTELNLDMIKHFPLDYIHLVLLGVVKRLLNFLTKGPPLCRIYIYQICNQPLCLKNCFCLMEKCHLNLTDSLIRLQNYHTGKPLSFASSFCTMALFF